MDRKTTIAILEDQIDVAAYLGKIISADPRLEIRAVFSSTEEALLTRLPDLDIDVFLVDLGLPGLDGVSFITQAKMLSPQSHFMVHTVTESSEKLWAALAAGAIGYILKGSHGQEVIEGLKIVAKGNTLLSPRMAAKLIRFFGAISGPTNPLTRRETDILNGLKSGKTYEEIAEVRFLSPHTVHTHVKRIYQKLHVSNRDEAVRKAVAFKLLADETA